MNIEEIKYTILDELQFEEPFFVMASPFKNNQSELLVFLDLLVELTNNGYIKCRIGDDYPVKLERADLYKYVHEIIRFGQHLNDIPEFATLWWNFQYTKLGESYVLDKHNKSREKGKMMVELLGKYKNDNEKYPQALFFLVPEYIEKVPIPMDQHGWWEYIPADDFLSYKLRMIQTKYDKSAYDYDSKTDKWAYEDI